MNIGFGSAIEIPDVDEVVDMGWEYLTNMEIPSFNIAEISAYIEMALHYIGLI